jgi:hypothetical protein
MMNKRLACIACILIGAAAALLILPSSLSAAPAAERAKPALVIEELFSAHRGVVPGQGFGAGVKVRNRGKVPVSIARVRLEFDNDGLRTEGFAGRITLPPAGEKTVKFVVEAGSSASQTRIMSAVFFSELAEGGAGLPVENRAKPVLVKVERPPLLEFVALRASKITVSANETFLTTVTVRNKGGAAAEFANESLVFQNKLLTSNPLAQVKTLPADGSTVSFTFQVRAGEFPGTCRVTGAQFVALDPVSKNRVPVAVNASPEALEITVVRDK